MPAKSKAQQKLFGAAKAIKEGDAPAKGQAGKIAQKMSAKEIDKFAGTKRKGLPVRKGKR